MILPIIILVVGFLLGMIGYLSENNFFSLAGGFLLLLSGIILLTTPIALPDGYTINDTSSVTVVSTTYSEPPALLSYAFNMVIMFVGMMLMWDSYQKLMEERHAKMEE